MRKKILFVIPSLVKSGAEHILVMILQHLNREQFQPAVLTLDSRNDFGSEIPADIKLLSLHKKNKWDNLNILFRLAKVIQEENPDLICSFISYTNYLCSIVKYFSRNKTPLIISERTYLSLALQLEQHIAIKRTLIRYYYPKANAIICVSQGIYNDLVKHIGVKQNQYKIIYNPIDISKIQKLALEDVNHSWFSENIPVFVACGRLVPQKNFSLLLNAVSLVLKSIPIRLIILGEGELRSSLIDLTAQLGIANSVSFLGFQQNPYKFMARAKGFILSSSLEGFGNVIIEAMACGTPVISTRCPSGPEEIITDGVNGIFVPVNNAPAMATAIKRLLSDTALQTQLVLQGKKRVADFNLEKIIAEYENYFLNFI
jgi:glycosyltransferase involved in cell wall biosynthesis